MWFKMVQEDTKLFNRIMVREEHELIEKESANALLHFCIGFGGKREFGLGSRAGQPESLDSRV